MTSTTCILNGFSSNGLPKAFELRREVQQFLAKLRGCTITGGGQSCSDPSCFDIHVEFRSQSAAKRIIGALAAKFAPRCTFDVDWMH